MTSAPIDAVAILVLVLGCCYIVNRIGLLLYRTARFFVLRVELYREQRRVEHALRQRIHDHIHRRSTLHLVQLTSDEEEKIVTK